MAKVEVSQAADADLREVRRLNIELHEFMVRGVPTRLRVPSSYDAAEADEYLKALLARSDATLLIARVNGSVVGYAEASVVASQPDDALIPATRVHLQSLLVTESMRGQGIGRHLLEAVEAWAEEAGASEVELDHWVFQGDPGDFYEEAGYRVFQVSRAAELPRPPRPSSR